MQLFSEKNSDAQNAALFFYTQKRGMPKEQALKEIEGLNDVQLACLIKLDIRNLRAHHLREFSPEEFSAFHAQYLIILIENKNYSPKEAINIINEMTLPEIKLECEFWPALRG